MNRDVKQRTFTSPPHAKSTTTTTTPRPPPHLMRRGAQSTFVPPIFRVSFVGRLIALLALACTSLAALAVLNGARSRTHTAPPMRSYSVWIGPPKESRAALLHRQVVDKSARHLSTPPFEPHVTLFAIVQGRQDAVLAAARRVAARTPRIPVRFKSVAKGERYFQCVYLLAEKNDVLVNANAALAREMASIGRVETPNDLYMPHLSLVYGHLPEHAREEMRTSISTEFGEALLGNDGAFVAESISVHETDPKDTSMKSWRTIAEYPLKGP
ncbi:hypothetical protein PPROV_000239500 [Pycnococcus provasolii]|uniref:Cyclic phosphodiesterase n=1 Tax=Pycnococcus provasolii TaxID=41880 RepID=A0A830HCN1_9CHLO|nr:hypothetical protein PPROV_000239500 [Pycnococcus provasolii]